MTRPEVAQLIALAVANFPANQKLDMTTTASLWLGALGDIPYPVAERALLMVLSTSRFWPTVADLREAALKLAPPTALPSPDAAWEELLRNIRRYGYMKLPEWSHPAIGRAADALYGGWAHLCQSMTVESTMPDRAHFLKIYDAQTKAEREAALLPLSVREAMPGAARMPALPKP